MAGHADQRPALRGEPLRLRAGGEPLALDDDERARRHGRPADLAGHGDGLLAAARTVRIGERDVDAAVVEEGLRAAAGPVDDLVGDDERPRAERWGQRADRAGGDDLPDAERTQRPQVGLVGDAMRRETVVPVMARQERHAPPGDLAYRDRVARRPERGIDLDLFGGVEELVETGTPDDPDIGDGRHGRQATFSPAEPDDVAAGDDPEEESFDEDEATAFLPLPLLSPEPSVLDSEPAAAGSLAAPSLRPSSFAPLPERLSVR